MKELTIDQLIALIAATRAYTGGAEAYWPLQKYDEAEKLHLKAINELNSRLKL